MQAYSAADMQFMRQGVALRRSVETSYHENVDIYLASSQLLRLVIMIVSL